MSNLSTAQRGGLCWGISGLILIVLIILTSTTSKDAPDEDDYYALPSIQKVLSPAQFQLYSGLGVASMQPYTYSRTRVNALAQFQLGLQLLHVFWYDLARESFLQAQRLDPTMAMAYWGEAMTYKAPLWQTENVAGGRAALAKLNNSRIRMDKLAGWEQAYIDAARSLYAADQTQAQREVAYRDAMKALYATYNDQADACALTALAELGLINSKVQNFDELQTVEIMSHAEDLLVIDCLTNYPNHVGALHYIVNLYDVADPSKAALGVPYAQKLALLTTSSSHAEHMGSHLYVRLGNWTMSIASNQAAIKASDQYCTAVKQGPTCDADNKYHALEWMEYSTLQQCSFSTGLTQLQTMQSVAMTLNYTAPYPQWVYRMYAHLVFTSQNFLGNAVTIYSPRSKTQPSIPPPLYDTTKIVMADEADVFWPPHAEAYALLARAFQLTWAKPARDLQAPSTVSTLDSIQARMDAIVVDQQARPTADDEMQDLLLSVNYQLQALRMAMDCNATKNATSCDSWRDFMEEVMSKYPGYANSTSLPTLRIVPAPEFYGTLLNVMTGTYADPATAESMFRMCLAAEPRRMNCVLGLARALRAKGDVTGAGTQYTMLQTMCARSTDTKFPGLLEAGAMTKPPVSSPPPRRGLRV